MSDPIIVRLWSSHQINSEFGRALMSSKDARYYDIVLLLAFILSLFVDEG